MRFRARPLSCLLGVGFLLLPAAAVEPAQSEESLLGHLLTHGGGVADDELISVLTETLLFMHKDSYSVLRRDFDLTGDGVAEIFLTFSEDSQRTEGNRWSVYDGDTSKTSAARFLGTVSFHGDHVRVTSPDTLRVFHRKNVGEAWLVDFYSTGSEFIEIQRREYETGDEVLDAERRAIREFSESGRVEAAWAELTREGLGPWIDLSTNEPVRDLAPIVSQRFTVSAAARVGPPSLLEDLGERLSCPQERCELIVELADLTGDGRPELIFHSSNFTGSPRPIYAKGAEGYRYLGGLPTGLWRLDDQKRVAVVKMSPPALARYRVTSEELTLLEELTLPAGRSEIDRERQAIADELSGRDPHAPFFRVPWSEAAGTPETPPWLTFKTREPAEIEVDLSSPVVNAETGGES
jgi:hypothetical protein